MRYILRQLHPRECEVFQAHLVILEKAMHASGKKSKENMERIAFSCDKSNGIKKSYLGNREIAI